MGLLLEKQFPGRSIFFVCVDPAPDTLLFLPSAMRIRTMPECDMGGVFIIVDCAEAKLTEYHVTHPQIFDGTYQSINFDHHPTNPNFGTVNFVVPSAASTCEIIVSFVDAANWQMDSDIATCLLTGVYTDTGGLLHSNTTSQVYKTVARLLRSGARLQSIITSVFRTANIKSLKLWGRVLEKISITDEGGAVSAVTEGDFRATGAEYSELAGVIDYVNAVPGMKFSLILSEREGKVKGSLRTLRDDVDVSEMAGKFQGGGHKKAAGFAIPGKLKSELRWKVVEDDQTVAAGGTAS